jgi:hypothetical protein
MRLLALLLVLAATIAGATGCAPREGAPDAAYRAFARAVESRDGDRAWGLLSGETRTWLDARAREVASAAPGVIAPDGRQLLLGTLSRAAPPPRSVLVVRESRDRAVVEVEEAGGAKREVELVREGGWRVVIPPPQQR